MAAQFDINWSARLSAVSANVSAGVVAVIDSTGSYVPATLANVTSGGVTVAAGVFLGSASSGQSVGIQQSGILSNEVTGLGAGTKVPVIADPTTARLVRKTTPLTSDIVVGLANERGDVAMSIGQTPSTGSGFVAATDLTGTSTNQTVVALRNVALSATAPTVAQSLTYNASTGWTATTSPIAPHNARAQYGAVADGTTNNSAAFVAAATAAGATRQVYLEPAASAYRISTDTNLPSGLWVANGATISIDAGVTLTVNGAFSADDYQSVFTGSGKVALMGSKYLSICWFGAEPTGTSDSAPAIQKAVDCAVIVTRVTLGAPRITPVPIYMPAGVYRRLSPTIVSDDNVTVFGDGTSSVDMTTYTAASRVLEQQAWIIMPKSKGGLTKVSSSLGDGNGYNLGIGPTHNYLAPGFDCLEMTPDKMNGRTQLAVSFFITIPTATPLNSIVNYGGSRGDGEGGTYPFSMTLENSNQITVWLITSAGTFFVGHPTVLTPGVRYHVMFQWNGTTARLHLGVVDGVTVNTNVSTAAGGSIVAQPWHQWSIGARLDKFPEGGVITQSFGVIESLFIRKVINGNYIANFIPPTVQDSADGQEIYGTNFKTFGALDQLVMGYSTGECFSPVKLGSLTPNPADVAFMKNFSMHGISIKGAGIYAEYAPNSEFRNLSFEGGITQLRLTNNCFESKVTTIAFQNPSFCALMMDHAAGVIQCDTILIQGGNTFGVVLYGGSATFTNVYPIAKCQMFIRDASALMNGCYLADEGVVTPSTLLYVSGTSWVTMNSGTIGVQSSTQALVTVDGATARLVFDQVNFRDRAASPGRFYVQSTTLAKDAIHIRDEAKDATAPQLAPWLTGPGAATNLQAFRISPENNSTGSVVITGAATSATVTFATAERDANYSVGLGLRVNSGSPVIGVPYWDSPATSGFTIKVGTAPGGTDSVRIHWSLQR